jgi:hypothetical protein
MGDLARLGFLTFYFSIVGPQVHLAWVQSGVETDPGGRETAVMASSTFSNITFCNRDTLIYPLFSWSIYRLAITPHDGVAYNTISTVTTLNVIWVRKTCIVSGLLSRNLFPETNKQKIPKDYFINMISNDSGVGTRWYMITTTIDSITK